MQKYIIYLNFATFPFSAAYNLIIFHNQGHTGSEFCVSDTSSGSQGVRHFVFVSIKISIDIPNHCHTGTGSQGVRHFVFGLDVLS